MKKKTLFQALLFFAIFSTTLSDIHAQDYLDERLIHDIYDWDEVADTVFLNASDSSESAVILKDATFMEFRTNWKTNSINGYYTKHQQTKILTTEGLQKYNRVYIPVADNTSIIKFKARSINPNGTVIEVDQSKVKDISNVEEYGSFKIFAIEGAVVGSIIEYLYTIPSELRYSFREIVQTDISKKEYTFLLKTTRNFRFKLGSSNGLNTYNHEGSEEFEVYSIQQSDIPPIREEAYSAFEANRMRLDISLTHANGNVLVSWMFLRKLYADILSDIGSRSASDARKYISDNTRHQSQSAIDKLITMENAVKRDFNLVDNNSEELSDVRLILKNKYANEVGIVKLYTEIFRNLGIEYQALVTTNRFSLKFNTRMPSLTYLNEFLFYLPEYDLYLSPTDPRYRIGIAPYALANNYALILNEEGNFSFHYIQMNQMEKNLTNNLFEIDFSEGLDNPILTKTNEWTGHRGTMYRGIYSMVPTENKEEFIEDVAISGTEGVQFINATVYNEDIETTVAEEDPFGIKSQLDISSLMEKAGRDYIFRIGEVIGPQVELYQEKERTNPIEMDFPIEYKHKIKFRIPEGYVVEGMEDVIINHMIIGEKEEVLGKFTSDYSVKNDSVSISINEYYTTSSLPIELYESFRNTINSAADFNKISIVFLRE